jgi:hypothetical protein
MLQQILGGIGKINIYPPLLLALRAKETQKK